MTNLVLTKQDVGTFNADGYLIKRAFFSKEETEKIYQTALDDKVLRDKAYELDDKEGMKTRLTLWYHPGDDIYGKVMRSQRMVNGVTALLGGSPAHYHTKLMQKEPKIGGAWEWHQDYGYWYKEGFIFPHMISVMVAFVITSYSIHYTKLYDTSDWSGNYSVIGDYASNGKVTFKDPLTYFPSQKQRFGYIILGTIKAMDKPHEWYKELGNNTIYYKASPGVNPNDLEIEMKKRDFTFDLQGAGNIIIKNIIHRGGGPVSFTPCKNFTFQENEVYGLSENGYGHMRIYGDNVQIKDNIFRQSYKSVMLVGGDRWDIVNNKFEDISYRIDDTGLEIDNTSSRFLISYNTFSGLGRGAS